MSGTLPTWMERWFGLANRPGMGTAWRLECHWPWPTWATLLAAALLLAVVSCVYLRENRGARRALRLMLAGLRLGQIGLALAMAAQFELLLQRTGLPFVIAIIDDTKSMNTLDRYDDALRASLQARVGRALSARAKPTRWNLARTLFTEDDGAMLRALSENYKLRFCFLSDLRESKAAEIPPIIAELKSADAQGDSTRLGTAVRSALDDLRGATPAAVVLASDGINTEGPGLLEAAAYARRRGVPLFLVGIGSGHPARDLRLSDLEVEETVFVNDLVHFRCKLTANGYQGKTVGIVLKREDQPADNAKPAGEIVGRAEVTVAADGRPQQVLIPYRPPQSGRFRFRIEIEPDIARGGGTDSPGFRRGERDGPPGYPIVSRGTTNTPPKDEATRVPPEEGAAKPAAKDETISAPLAAAIDVRDEKIRILLVDGSPRYEWRYLYNMLARDPTIELHTFLQDADMELGDEPQTKFLKDFPVSLSDPLKHDVKYDVIIFGDVNPSLLSPTALQNLADFVDHSEHGGALVLIAGPNFMPRAYADTPLARLLPFNPSTAREPDPNKPQHESFVARPTELGQLNSAMQLEDTSEDSRAKWQALPPLYWMMQVSDLTAAAQVLAEDPARTGPDGKQFPLIILQYVGGGGRILFHATDETYRWRRRQGDLYFARYWVQMLRFLARAKLAEGEGAVRLSTDRREYRPGDQVQLQAAFADDRAAPLDDNGVTVELEQSGRQTEKVRLHRSDAGRGRFQAALQSLPTGMYHARMIVPSLSAGVPAADFIVASPQPELARVQMDAGEMRQAAALTNGKYYAFEDATRLPDDLPSGHPVPVENLPPVPLWNRWPVLLLFLVLLIAEWVLRKRGGMI